MPACAGFMYDKNHFHSGFYHTVNITLYRESRYNAFNVYCRELAPGTVSLTGYRAQGDDGKHCAYYSYSSFKDR